VRLYIVTLLQNNLTFIVVSIVKHFHVKKDAASSFICDYYGYLQAGLFWTGILGRLTLFNCGDLQTALTLHTVFPLVEVVDFKPLASHCCRYDLRQRL
jgi:hypothetical protein